MITKDEMFDYFFKFNLSLDKEHDFTYEELEAYIDYLWYKYDNDSDGVLMLSETKPFYFDLINDRKDLNLTLDMHEDWFNLIDYDSDGAITRDEMLRYFSSIKYAGKGHLNDNNHA